MEERTVGAGLLILPGPDHLRPPRRVEPDPGGAPEVPPRGGSGRDETGGPTGPPALSPGSRQTAQGHPPRPPGPDQLRPRPSGDASLLGREVPFGARAGARRD